MEGFYQILGILLILYFRFGGLVVEISARYLCIKLDGVFTTLQIGKGRVFSTVIISDRTQAESGF